MTTVGAATRQLEPWLDDLTVPSRLHTQNVLGIQESLTGVVDQNAVGRITEWKAHARRDENVLPTVRIQVADTQAPRPEVLCIDLIRYFVERAVTVIPVERVAEDAPPLAPKCLLAKARIPRKPHSLQLLVRARLKIDGHV